MLIQKFPKLFNTKNIIAITIIFMITVQSPLAFAISQDSVTVNVDEGSTSFTFAHTVSGTDRIILVGVSHRQCLDQLSGTLARDVTSVTYNNLPLTKIIGPNDRLGACSDLWYLLAPPLGTHQVQVNFNLSPNAAVMSAMSFTGVDQNDPIGDSASAHNGFNIATPSVTVNADTGDLVVDVLTIRNDPATVTQGTGQTLLYETENMDLLSGAASTKIATSPVTMTWSATQLTNPTDGWAQVAVVLNPSLVLVGGEIIPIETISLILAGAQSFSWMIPVVFSVLGLGLFIISKKIE